MKKERRTFSEWFKDIAGIEGDLKDTLKPAVGYTSGNIMLGGAGYPISMYHQQYLTYVEGLSTKQAGFISLIGSSPLLCQMGPPAVRPAGSNHAHYSTRFCK